MSNHEDLKILISGFSGQNSIVTVPRVYVEVTGDYNTAILLNQIIFWSDKTKRKDGLFYKTYADWEEEILLSEYQVRRSVGVLKELGFVETKIKRANGSPTVHYKYKHEKVSVSILKFLKNGNLSKLRMDSEVTKETITDDYTDDYKQKKEPIVVSKETDEIPYEEIIDYLNLKADRNFVSKGKRSTNHRKYIKARWNDGYRLKDFKDTIDNMVAVSKVNEFWLSYLQPSTLFNGKMNEHMNKPIPKGKKQTKPKSNEDRYNKSEIKGV